MAKGIIFDLDGTMVDNMMIHHRAWQKKLAEMGLFLELEEVKEKIHGINEEILHRLFGDRFTAEERRRISWEKEALYREIYLPELRPVDGLVELLEGFYDRNIPIGIGTAAPIENMNFVLDNLDIRRMIHTAQHAGDVKKGKPDPEIYLNVSEAMGIDPGKCIIFEDTPTGADAASRAGSKVVVVTTTHEPAEFEHIPSIIRFIKDYREISVGELLSSP